MIQTVNNLVFGGNKPAVNTIIGGLGNVLNTREAFLLKFNLPSSSLRRYDIIDGDIYCHISTNYSIPNPSFYANDTNITKYIDLDGKLMSLTDRCFSASTITEVYMPSIAYVPLWAFTDSINLTNVYMPKIKIISGGGFANCPIQITDFPLLESLVADSLNNTKSFEFNFPLLTTAGSDRAMQGNTNLTTVYAPLLKTCGNRTFYLCSSITSFHAPNIETSGQFCFAGFTNLTSINLPKLKTCAVYGFYNMILITELILPELTTTSGDNQSIFRNLTSCDLISMRKLTYLGIVDNHNNTFVGLKLGCTIEVNIALSTANAGVVHTALVWVKANRGAIVKFYNDDGTYNSTL